MELTWFLFTQLELTTVGNNDRGSGTVLCIDWHVGYLGNYIFVASDNLAKNNVLSWEMNQIARREGCRYGRAIQMGTFPQGDKELRTWVAGMRRSVCLRVRQEPCHLCLVLCLPCTADPLRPEGERDPHQESCHQR